MPGMFFIASSTGRVIVAIISSAGITPLSMRITTRGKVGLREDRGRHDVGRIGPGQAEGGGREREWPCGAGARTNRE